ncbi:uncharacterized protein si:dkey-245n4.2 isoform X1 [Conger conger]|uniref:uncharacterized protein si:dkey-245n4.2 isoform X1 n=1 Tax=Conger conger TaxID=82655 RepID=UPI002A59C32A|nr:uncharacterized protein si:dkey-245n4.2 isoform X1 [Conger conger]
MERGVCIITALVLIVQEAVGFSIRNEQLGRCLQPLEGGVVLEECGPGSAPQEWEWRPHTRALVNVQTGECLSAKRPLDQEAVHLDACAVGYEEAQAWVCSKKGHLTRPGAHRLHLSAHRDTDSIVLARERGRGSKWRTLGNLTVCDEPGAPHYKHHHGDKPMPTASVDGESVAAGVDDGPGLSAMTAPNLTESASEEKLPSLSSSTTDPSPARGPGPSAAPFFSLEYGLGWKVAMLVLSSLALVIGVLVLLLSIHYNRKKKVMCVVKSYVPTGEVSQQGSPVPNERAPLTRHPLRPPSSPSLQRGEILIEWKDGTVTPLFDTNTLPAD